MSYLSQHHQDQFVDEYFARKTGGTYIDVGAHDGKTISNTFFFEQERQWKGICVEPNKEVFPTLVRNRNPSCIPVMAAASDHNGYDVYLQIQGYAEMLSGLINDYDPRHLQRIGSEVQNRGGSFKCQLVETLTLTDICKKHGMNKVDYLSIDTEGSELKVLRGLDLKQVQVQLIGVENNYRDAFHLVDSYLKENGYKPLKDVGGDCFYDKGR